MAYSWVPLFKEITDWISGYSDRQEELVTILRDIGIENINDKDSLGKTISLSEIDPFSFFAAILRFGYSKRKNFLGALINSQGFINTIPEDFDGVPNAMRMNAMLFPFVDKRENWMISSLWAAFNAAKKGALTEDQFTRALNVPQNGMAKMTQALFWAFPEKYFPVDKQTRPWLEDNRYSVPNDFISYQALLRDLKQNDDRPFYELSYIAWEEMQDETDEEDEGIDLNYDALEEFDVFNPESVLELNQILCGPPGTGKTFATAAIAVKIADNDWYSEKYNELAWSDFFEAVKERYDELVEQNRVVFTTFHQSFAYEDFIEGIRATTESGKEGLSYEVMDGVFYKICNSAEAKVIYQSEDEIDLEGRQIWKMSLGNTLFDEDVYYQECLENNYVLLGYGRDIDFAACKSRHAVQAKLESHINDKISANDYETTSVNIFVNSVQKGDLIVVSDGNYKFRAIAEVMEDYKLLETDERVGYQQKRGVKWLRIYEPSLPKEQLFKKSLSQQSIYELRPHSIDLEKLAILLAPQIDSEQEDLPYVVIIDEINRGNISRIFGELITLLEPDKRKGAENALSTMLPYSKRIFSVPDNVFILGTMNSADRSLAQMDLALRRRFNFIEMAPIPELLDEIYVHGVSISELLDIINQRIEALLGREYMIGHSYFITLKDSDVDELESALAGIFKHKIIPLLQEYFFDDWERIRWVLNDQNKESDACFVTRGGQESLLTLFGAEISKQLSDRRYRINDGAFNNPEAYRGILGAGEDE
ncbi:AAA family ATPase [Desulfovibrio gilichinskyi]|uniref:5-methylcytosine-specific restriction enzyme B n=1 Tax=Desulfovibrio gilichinskyi TaxID=1519643 RepID=A0A1X7F2E4_9BACT|nr:AAA family ATPase [Desulfovibrio gilichinskyi]SMF44125.1 5-methylcytosine-specific restriction enzyme B [Desulfovibrio gilichinskyi]